MTIQEAKDFLGNGYRIKERIAAKERRIAEWERRAKSVTIEIKPVASFSSFPVKKVEEAACAIADLQSELRREICELVKTEQEIGKAINSAITDPTLKTILEMRYLNCLRWEEIAFALNLTLRWTLALHKKALNFFAESALIHV